ncbi:hypothetical protein JOB18_047399 [Solea senegalensis]|uniref:CD99 antigen-like protein 2 n=1 Tax=Solea senegalensis TaxID=28829 RepID=A0AAV6RIT4_SOLSE|nr:CD99 molecule isoform X2 [Solea senegalensis]KAG7503926.1 hypothetical protein JOB18_047399 [Solea senegalensis]
MKLSLRTIFLLLLVSGTLAQDGFNLFDALDDPDPTPQKPEEKPKAPEKPKNDGGFDLLDAFGPDETPTEKPKKPSSGDSGGFGLDLEDALGPDLDPKPDKPNVNLPDKNGGGGGNFGDSDLFDIGGGDYKPDGGHSGGKGQAGDSGYDQGGNEQPQDPDLPWGQILKMLNTNMPEEFYVWMSNLKQILTPLLERAMDLLHAIP